MIKLTVRKVGNSLGVILPQEALSLLHVKEGDSLTMVETEDGAKLSAGSPEFDRQVVLGKDLIQRYRNTLRKLAE